MRDIVSINSNWKFYLGDFTWKRNPRCLKKSGAWLEGPESMDFDDSEWKQICIPHDFVIGTEPYPVFFGKKEEGMDEERVLNAYGAFPDNVGWYRKHFYISDNDKDKKIYLVFDGIYRNSDVYLNNFYIGHHNSGFSGVKYDITLADSLKRCVFMGRAQLVIKTDGKVMLSARSAGLKSASIYI